VTREPLERFSLIVPCGISSVRMTSLASEGRTTDGEAVYEAVREGFARAFEADVVRAAPARPGETPRIGAGAA